MKKTTASILFATSIFHVSGAVAEDYPSRPIRMVMPYTAGGGADQLGRLLARELEIKLGQTVIVENISGANGIIGTEAVKRFPADGYTILYSLSSIIVSPLLQKVNYDPFTDFEPVAEVSRTPILLMAGSKTGIHSVQQLIERAEQSPGTISYGSYGVGSGAHLYTEMLQSQKNISLNHIAYRGTAQSTNDLIAGTIDTAYLIPGVAEQNIKSYGLVPLLSSSKQRLEDFPDVPTFDEIGIQGIDSGWQTFFVRSGTPEAARQKLETVLLEIVNDPAVIPRMKVMGIMATGVKGDPFKTMLKNDYDMWKKVIQERSIKLE